MGLDILYSENYTTLSGAMDWRQQGPQTWDVAEQVWGLRWDNGRRPSYKKKDQVGVLESGCLGLSIPVAV